MVFFMYLLVAYFSYIFIFAAQIDCLSTHLFVHRKFAPSDPVKWNYFHSTRLVSYLFPLKSDSVGHCSWSWQTFISCYMLLETLSPKPWTSCGHHPISKSLAVSFLVPKFTLPASVWLFPAAISVMPLTTDSKLLVNQLVRPWFLPSCSLILSESPLWFTLFLR